MTPRPFYQVDGVTLYHGDAGEILAGLEPVDVILTDPIWPGCEHVFPGVDAAAVFARVAAHFPRLCRRLIVHLGLMSDPRFLAGVPAELPFSRACWLRYIVPGYHGTVLNAADVAYIFGSNYRTGNGDRVMPSECGRTTPERGLRAAIDHPCPRHPFHLDWLVDNYTAPTDVILDPFAGSGTTLVAAAKAGRKVIGVELEEKYCRVAVDRITAFRNGVSFQDFTNGQHGLFKCER